MQIFAPKKKPRVQPLSSKDIYVAELDCKDSIDRTEQYRAMIAQSISISMLRASSSRSTKRR